MPERIGDGSPKEGEAMAERNRRSRRDAEKQKRGKKLVGEQARSGKSIREFCREQGVAEGGGDVVPAPSGASRADPRKTTLAGTGTGDNYPRSLVKH